MQRASENPVIRLLIFVLLAVSLGAITISLYAEQYGSIKAIVSFYVTPTPSLLTQVAMMVIFVLSVTVGWCVIAIRSATAQRYLGALLVLLSLLPLFSLVGPQHYMAELGGFPLLGSGQGVIKFLALFSLGISLWRWRVAGASELFWLNFTPVALVLLWIGGMKFYAFEAEGIVDLVSSSPLLSWLYLFADQQQASNLIGSFDWLAVLLLAIGFWHPRLFVVGFAMSVSVFLTTQSFLLTYPGAWSGRAVLSSGGVFIIKDLWFIANMLLLIVAFRQKTNQSRR